MIKIVKKTLVMLLIVAFSQSCKKENAKDTNNTLQVEKSTTENVKTATFEIEGMTCAVGCAGLIESKLNKLEGVIEAKVNFDTKTATITFDSEKLNEEMITKTVEDLAGGKLYKVLGFKA
ncbi:MAG TPA: heavy metal transporter [Flavobacterium sp.]|nr:heavy metal transporter [Flavobacterium sp.]